MDGNFPVVYQQTSNQASNHASAAVSSFSGGPSGGHSSDGSIAALADTMTAAVGRPNADSLAYAQQLIEENDATLNSAAHDPHDAQALVYCMLIDRDAATTRQQQLASLQGKNRAGHLFRG